MEMDQMETLKLLQLIQDRRSIFPNSFTGELVPREMIDQMLESANWAPTHRFTEPWRFIVFEGKGLKTFADFQAMRYKSRTPTEQFNNNKFEKLKNKPLLCSHLIAVCMKRDENNSVPELEEIVAVSCAIQNMLLTAASLGIGCYLSTGGVTYDEEAKEFFELGREDKIIGFLYIGSANRVLGKGRREGLDKKVRWIS